MINTLKTNSREQLEFELKMTNLEELPRSMTLTAQEVYMIQQAGYEPVQVVFGSIVYSMGVKGLLKSLRRALQQGEMPDFSQMNQDARNIARNRLLEEAQKIGATHVMDIKFEEHEWSDFLEVVAQGTACKKIANAKEMPIVVS